MCGAVQHGKDFISPDTGIITYEDGANDPFTLHMFYPPLCLGQWAGLRETTLVETTMSRKEKETLASFVSLTNECVFCMTSHKVAARSQGAGEWRLDVWGLGCRMAHCAKGLDSRSEDSADSKSWSWSWRCFLL